eukprot:gene20401-22414_t
MAEAVGEKERQQPLIQFETEEDRKSTEFETVNDDQLRPVVDCSFHGKKNGVRAEEGITEASTEMEIIPEEDVQLESVVNFKSSEQRDLDNRNSDTSADEIQHHRNEENNFTPVPNEIDEIPIRKGSFPGDFSLLLASTYVNEAFYGRNGIFVPEAKELNIYKWYNNCYVRFCLYAVIWVNMSLVLFEKPAVDGWLLPYWATMLIEMVCLCGYFMRLVHGWSFMPKWRHWQDKKILIVLVCLLLTLLDMALYIILIQTDNEKYAIRWSRVLRPAFMINFSESRQIRRAFRNIRRTLPEIANVLILLLLMISLYALLGLKLFQKRKLKTATGRPYFENYFDIFFSLYVLTTTANNPDIAIPAYNSNNWYSLYFVIYVIICMYIFVSIFLAVVYKNYRKHLKNEVKAIVYRKRRNLNSAFNCIKIKSKGQYIVTFHRWKALMHYMAPKMSPVHLMLIWHVLDENSDGKIGFKEFTHMADLLCVKMKEIYQKKQFFERISPSCFNNKVVSFIRKCVQHRWFVYFFDLVIVANAICIGFDVDEAEIAFLVLFNLEIFLKVYTLGVKKFFSRFWNIFDFLVIGSATIVLIFESLFLSLKTSEGTLDLLMVLRVLRLFKIVGNYHRFKVIINTILQIGPAILTYGGIMFVFYYIFSIVGMEAFSGRINDIPNDNMHGNHSTNLSTSFCGNIKLRDSEFYRLHYCGKNFNNVLKSFNTLFDLTVVNQWHVITDGFVRVTNKAARIYFLLFHLLCVIVVLNIFVAFVLEAFMLQYSFSKTKYEAALERKIEEKCAGTPEVVSNPVNSTENPLDENFSITQYVMKARVSYSLKKRKTKNAEEILQQMFEDELNEDDLGPNLQDMDLLNDAIEHQNEQQAKSRSLTLQNVDIQL